MKLTEAEMRMVFQIESTNQNAALNEIYMTWRYAPNPATKETAEGLLDKLRPLSDQECMDLIRKVQAEYRKMLQNLGSEFEILRTVPLEEIRRVSGYSIAEGIGRLRKGKVEKIPGFDGEYGTIKLFQPYELEEVDRQR